MAWKKSGNDSNADFSNSVQEALKRQAEWQASLRSLPWSVKIEMAARVRKSLIHFRQFSRNRHEPA